MEIDILTEDDAWLALPDREALAGKAAKAVFDVLGTSEPQAELSILFTSDAAMAELNRIWRGMAEPTNVLSFPAGGGQAGPQVALGDIALAAGVVSAEADAEAKPLANHATHLIIHGLLHLLGHDHADEATAEAMRGLETQAMARLGLPGPYEEAKPRPGSPRSCAAG